MNEPKQREKRKPTPAQRRRQIRKNFRRKQARRQRVLSMLANPLELAIVTPDYIPEHLQCPSSLRGCRRLVFEHEAQVHFFTSPWMPIDEMTPPGDLEPELPRLLRKTKRAFISDEIDIASLITLPCGHALSPTELADWHSQGRYRAIYYFHTHPDDPHPNGQWALIYEQELEWILPSLSLKWNRRRSEYFVQILRDEEGVVYEMRVYSKAFKPIFRSPLALPPEYQPDHSMQNWWQRRTFEQSQLKKRYC